MTQDNQETTASATVSSDNKTKSKCYYTVQKLKTPQNCSV